MTIVDPTTGKMDPKMEPLRTLRSYVRYEIHNKLLWGHLVSNDTEKKTLSIHCLFRLLGVFNADPLLHSCEWRNMSYFLVRLI